MFTWRRINHEFVEKRYGRPPFGWNIVEGPELGPEAYYDDNNVLATARIIMRTRPLQTNGQMHIEALRTGANGPVVNIDRNEINNLINHHFQGSTGATTVHDLESLCVIKTTRTVLMARETFGGVERRFRIVLDRAIWYVIPSQHPHWSVIRAPRGVSTAVA